MSVAALVMMISVCGFVWGGFLLLLWRAISREGAKTRDRLDDHPVHPSP